MHDSVTVDGHAPVYHPREWGGEMYIIVNGMTQEAALVSTLWSSCQGDIFSSTVVQDGWTLRSRRKRNSGE